MRRKLSHMYLVQSLDSNLWLKTKDSEFESQISKRWLVIIVHCFIFNRPNWCHKLNFLSHSTLHDAVHVNLILVLSSNAKKLNRNGKKISNSSNKYNQLRPLGWHLFQTWIIKLNYNCWQLCVCLFSILGILAGKIIFSLCIAKFFIVFAFDGFYVYSAELFPTVVRYLCAHIFGERMFQELDIMKLMTMKIIMTMTITMILMMIMIKK